MKIFSVGPDLLNDDYELDKVNKDLYQFGVYWYRIDGYEGCGEFVALSKDNIIHSTNLSHCSCYGPMDGWPHNPSKMTLEEYLRPKDSVHDYDGYGYSGYDIVLAKVKELLETII